MTVSKRNSLCLQWKSTMSTSVFSVDNLLTTSPPMDYEITGTATARTGRSTVDAMHSESDTEDTKDSKCSSPVNSHNSESLDVRNASVSNLSQDILETMIQNCRRIAANCDCGGGGDNQDKRSIKMCEKCAATKKFKLNLSESFQSEKCNTIIDEPVKPVLKFSVSAILSGTKSSSTDDRLLKSRNGKKGMEVH